MTNTCRNKLALHLLILLSHKSWLNVSANEYLIDTGYVCQTTGRGAMGEEGKEYEKIKDVDCNKCQKKCTGKDWCVAYECGENNCELWRCKPEWMEVSHGYDCAWKNGPGSYCSSDDWKDKNYEVKKDHLCRTDDYPQERGFGTEGIDYQPFDALNSKACEDACSARDWCVATESRKGYGHCELWKYKPEKFEFKPGYDCKWKNYQAGTDKLCAIARRKGYQKARGIYYLHYKDDCDWIFEFDAQVKILLTNTYADNKCARKGVKEFDLWASKICLTPVECNEYGDLAADLVINEFCKLYSVSRRSNTIKEQCREEAKFRCQGYLYEALENLLGNGYKCPEINDNPQMFFKYAPELREKCVTVVKSLTSA